MNINHISCGENMCITLVGGMDRLRPAYEAAARESGCMLTHIARNERNFQNKIGDPDMIIIFTSKISHEAKRKAAEIGKARKIAVRMLHSCGLSSLRECLRASVKSKNASSCRMQGNI